MRIFAAFLIAMPMMSPVGIPYDIALSKHVSFKRCRFLDDDSCTFRRLHDAQLLDSNATSKSIRSWNLRPETWDL